MEWKGLETAPKNTPVKVWASYDPANPSYSFREKTAVYCGYGWWKEWGRNGSRIFPTHWRPLPEPPKE